MPTGVQAHEESNAFASLARTRACSKSAVATAAAKQRHIEAKAFRASSVLQ